MEIEIYADVVCPWCFIGKRRLEKALESYPGDVTVRYRPFQLDPSPVPRPEPTIEALARKFGGPERARQITEQTTQTALRDGLELNFAKSLTANTFDAHRLVRVADQVGKSEALVEALYQAHFVDGVDVGSHDELARLAGTVGLDEAEAKAYLDSGEGTDETRAALAEARDLGVTAVPMFVFAGKYGVSGAQEPATLLEVLAEVEKREAASAS
ncbi:putative DsbA family dithiol-disulfide isomerase [Asanoa ferruginea]|uniref:Putative DsbA family dithiol-disulfide isomerase n=1 Tax=Asanoa ferruginea TaxID=53367 RepID=A0A3D9ZKC9_9ACTN|nr:DsbA family oxidoreductase [Asanoa ferruginea]REF96383.1 putative DsbA family dithiol-disulfide isomerase [Asanoa ferruginea]GIF47029.1 DSBA oxidoreductase [Asanoa ferruginea]